MLPVSLDCPFWIAPSVSSNIYLTIYISEIAFLFRLLGFVPLKVFQVMCLSYFVDLIVLDEGYSRQSLCAFN